MKKFTEKLVFTFFLAVAALVTATTAPAQTKDGEKAKHDKKYVVRVLTIEDGDTTVTDHDVDDGDEALTWVGDDGDEFTVMVGDEVDAGAEADMKEDMTAEVLGEKKYNAYVLKSGKKGKPVNIFVKKKQGGHGDMDCCGGGSGCKMGMKDSDGMHGKMGKDEMMRMHEKMSKEEMERMHGKMGKMHHDDDDDDGDQEKDDDSGSDSDDDGGNLR